MKRYGVALAALLAACAPEPEAPPPKAPVVVLPAPPSPPAPPLPWLPPGVDVTYTLELVREPPQHVHSEQLYLLIRPAPRGSRLVLIGTS